MSFSAIYDIQGNLSALKTVFDDLKQYKAKDIVIEGDLVWGREPRGDNGFIDAFNKYKNR
ncbi:hypothetical protein FZC66_09790 [Priestia megaterium]|nr:hypothetical protein FZC66_09790 [Priestia megaterium]